MLDNEQEWHSISLRFCGDELDLAAVTADLGLEPDSTGRIGEHVRGNPRYAKFETNIWVHRYTDEGADGLFVDELSKFITRLEARAEVVRQLSARPGVTAELFIGFSSGSGQGGFTLPSALLSRIAKLGLDVSLDLYPPTVDRGST